MRKLYKIFISIITVQFLMVSSGEAAEKKCLVLTKTENIDAQYVSDRLENAVIAVVPIKRKVGKKQPTPKQASAAATYIAEELIKADPEVAQKSDAYLENKIAEMFAAELTGTSAPKLSPLVAIVNEFKVDPELSEKLMGMDSDNQLQNVDVDLSRLSLVGAVQMPPATFATVSKVAQPLLTNYIRNLTCELGEGSQVVSVGANVIAGVACSTDRNHIVPVAQISSDEKTAKIFNQACATMNSGPTYVYSIRVWNLDDLTMKVRGKFELLSSS